MVMMLEDELIKLHASAEEDFDGEDTEDHLRLDEDDEDEDDEEEEFSSSRDDEDDSTPHDTTHAEDAEMFSAPSTPVDPYEPPTRESAQPVENAAETSLGETLKDTPKAAPAKKAAA